MVVTTGVPLDSCAHSSLKRSRHLFATATSNFVPREDSTVYALSHARRRRITGSSTTPQVTQSPSSSSFSTSQALVAVHKTVSSANEKNLQSHTTSSSSVLALSALDQGATALSSSSSGSAALTAKVGKGGSSGGGILVASKDRKPATGVSIPTPTWHAPWKLSTVLSSHLGWVRSIAMEPTNRLFATGSADRTIKIWNLASAAVGDTSNALQLTLTGHISPVRGLAFSPRHPYLFSAGEDKMVKCWDLETNQVVRHYHGHLSGVYCLKLHPTLDVLVTAGRDAVARVWDMRTKTQLHCLSGHDNTVGCLLVNSMSPSIVTGSQDSTIKLWDLVAGKCVTTLTHHQKGIRALVQAPFERTFCSGAADGLKKYTGTRGQFLSTFSGHRTIINAMAINEDGVMVSGGDDGSLRFWDYKSGYDFQSAESIVQPGTLEAENGIMALEFDLTGTRLITGECDKTIKIYRSDDEASDFSHPIDTAAWRKKCLAVAKQRY